jgi:hypothetical protein
MKLIPSIHKTALTIAASILAVSGAQAYDLTLKTNWPAISFHGFGSQGFLLSDKYDYLGETRNGSFKFTEAGLNASINPFPRTRISVQGFTYDVGDAGEYDVVLDYAQAEYTFSDYIGVRGGRIRRPEGIYNHIQDVDLARTWVLLPQGMYNARWRDFYTSIDGGEIFGTLPLAKAGNLSYEIFSGLQRPQLNGGLALQKKNSAPYLPLSWVNSSLQIGGQLWWNTPVDGLRAGAGLNTSRDLQFETSNGRLAKGDPFVQRYSLEYAWRKWTFQAEYYTYAIDYALSGGGSPNATRHIEPDSWYGSAAYRVNKWVELGTYYSEYYADVHHRDGAANYQKDWTVAARFDLTDWWVFKVEGHYIHGTAQLFERNEPRTTSDGWFMLALKTTVSF